MVEEYIRNTIARFNEMAQSDEKLKAEIQNFNRKIMIKLDDGRTFHFLLFNGKAGELQNGAIDDAQIVIESDEDTVKKLCTKEVRVMKAFATKKLRVKAPLEDILRLRKFF